MTAVYIAIGVTSFGALQAVLAVALKQWLIGFQQRVEQAMTRQEMALSRLDRDLAVLSERAVTKDGHGAQLEVLVGRVRDLEERDRVQEERATDLSSRLEVAESSISAMSPDWKRVMDVLKPS